MVRFVARAAWHWLRGGAILHAYGYERVRSAASRSRAHHTNHNVGGRQ
jgi:hypothetical protein